ncbi:MAG: tRNA (adenosine(37)-N6)-dimethylallyltransferase MiaA [Planctomycetota bacterium]|nr:MAG: tRNA (adenosine(37)-N6)-dimethylallyltransferase MiaA [Planctomycetota bacterium]
MDTFAPVDDCWFLTGPTASGKTALSLELAERLGAEILSLDSMAVYRRMEIGTAKPDTATRARVAHHLIDLVEPTEDFSISQYLEHAHRAVDDIRSRGREALFVGGTPLYLKALLRGLADGPPGDPELRAQLESEAEQQGSAELHARLAEVDPEAARRVHPHDTRRIVRALEVFAKMGQPMSDYQQHFAQGRAAKDCRVFVLNWPRDVLHQRINARVETMFVEGLVEEVRGLLADYGRLGTTAAQAVGYREVIQYLDGARAPHSRRSATADLSPPVDLPQTIELTKARTRQFARRQLIWFRGLSECRWIGMSDQTNVAELAARIAAE